MEVAGTVFGQVPCFSSNSSGLLQSRSFCPNRKSLITLATCDEFSDKAHLQYYSRPRMAMKEKEMKKQLKLLKKNLSIFSDMGFGLNLDNGLDEQVRGKMISEATEVLVGQLQKLKAEKMELKRMKKEEKAKKKAAKMMEECKSKEEESSSSSSSESECEKINVSHGEETTSSLMVVDDKQVVEKSKNINSSSMSLRLENKIEVCMGGKCKKSGAAMLLENFQKAAFGIDEEAIAVVGCKCMGKCKDGPNVKVVVVDNSNGLGLGGLCMGVRLEDVDSIVNDYLFPPNRNTTTAPAM